MAQNSLSIAGSVLDASGSAIPYAHVEARKLEGGGGFGGFIIGAPTNSAGAYTLFVPAGSWKVTAFAPGYGKLPDYTVNVSATNMTQNISASVDGFGTVTGRLTQNGAGVVGAFVNAFGPNGGNQTTTGSGGVYSMKLQTGTYSIEGFMQGTGPTNRLANINATGGVVTSGKNLTIAQTATIRVVVKDGDNNDIIDAFADARDSSGMGAGAGYSATGYLIKVPAGTYTVRAGNQRVGIIGTQTSVVASGGQTTVVNITGSKTYAVSGTISSSNDACVNGVGIGFSNKDTGVVTVANTGTGSTFSVSLPNGTYSVMAGKPGCIDNDSAATVTVASATVSSVNRTLTKTTSTITGNVTLDGSPVTADTKVIAYNSAGKYVFADVSNGSYSLDVSSGDWTVSARSEGYASTAMTASAGGTANLTLSAISGYTKKEPRSTQVTPTSGGVAKNSDIGSDFSVEIPAGAISSTDTTASTIASNSTTAVPTATASAKLVGASAIEIDVTKGDGNASSTLTSPATIKIPYTADDVAAAGVTDETKLKIASWNDNTQSWDTLPTVVDTTNKVLVASTLHFSVFGKVVSNAGGTTSSTTSASTSGTSGGGSHGGGSRYRNGLPTITVGQAIVPIETLASPSLNRALTVVAQTELKGVRGLLSQVIGSRKVVFKDVPVAQWFAPYVSTVLKAGIASGYKDAAGNPTGEFKPTSNVTYGELAKMALESAGVSPASGIVPRNRSAINHWSAGYINVMESVGASAYSTMPSVEAPASRGAVIQTLVDVLNITDVPASTPAKNTGTGTTKSGSGATATGSGTALTGSGKTVTATGSGTSKSSAKTGSGSLATVVAAKPQEISFTDLKSTNQYTKAILLLAKLGVISGDTDRKGKPTGKVRPNSPVNRAEVAKIFTKLIELKYIH